MAAFSPNTVPRPGVWFAQIMAIFLQPIAIPGWAIERLVRTRNPGWEFHTVSAIPYFLSLVALGSTCILVGPLWSVPLGLYILFAVELVCLWLALIVGLGRPGDTYRLLHSLGRRFAPLKKDSLFITPKGLFQAATVYLYSLFFFATTDLAIVRFAPNAFAGLTATSRLGQLGDFLYFSIVTMATVGYGDIHPISAAAKAMTSLEILVGIFFLVFLFGGFVSHHINRLSGPRNTPQ